MPSTTQRRSRLQHGYCIGVSRRSAQAIAGKGLAKGPYVTARAGVEPTTLRFRVIASTNAPSRHTTLRTSIIFFIIVVSVIVIIVIIIIFIFIIVVIIIIVIIIFISFFPEALHYPGP